MLRHIARRAGMAAPATPNYVCLFCAGSKPVNLSRLYSTTISEGAERSERSTTESDKLSSEGAAAKRPGYKFGRSPRRPSSRPPTKRPWSTVPVESKTSESKDGESEVGEKKDENGEPKSKNALRKEAKKAKKMYYEKEEKTKLGLAEKMAREKGVVGKPKPPKSAVLEYKQKKRQEHNEVKKTSKLIDSARISALDLELKPIPIEGQRPVPRLSHGLDRVIFSGAVYQLQDPRTKVYNFDPYLQEILPVTDFDFDAVGRYITSSKDNTLTTLAKKLDKKYVGSTSSMSSVLSHFHYLISNWRPLNFDMISAGFPVQSKTFTRYNRAPTAIFLRYKEDEDVYAIDADKEFDSDSVLSLLGRSMEKLLTIPPASFEKYKKENSHVLTEEDRNVPDTYNYTTLGDFLMRSQLDAFDPRLPGTGMFDLKTRASAGVRADVENFHMYAGYQIFQQKGAWFSFEREYYDMIRAAFMKYTLQARMGRMDGMFVAFHNTERIFGFQYVPLSEMDRAIHGNSPVGDGEFKLSVKLLGELLSLAQTRFPKQSLRLHFECRDTSFPEMQIFIEPMTEEGIQAIQNKKRQDIENFLETVALKNREAEVVFGRRPSERHAAEGAAKEEQQPDKEEFLEDVKASNKLIEERMLEDRKLVKEAADEEFAAPPSGALLALSISTKSLINGKEVPRVSAVSPHDDWELEYTVREMTNADDAWRKYRSCKKRRREAGLASNLTPSEKETNFYLKQMRKLSVQGRKMLNDSLDKEAGMGEKFVWRHEEHND